MKLSYVSVTNYRSISDAYKIDLSDFTVLIGKNNEGKTNIIHAITLGMEIILNMETYSRRSFIQKNMYSWNEDFPIKLQNSKKKDKSTKIRFDFSMSEQESNQLSAIINSNINTAISIYISINDKNKLSVTVPKKGKNAKAISAKIIDICKFICENFYVQYIPAVRSINDAYNAITEMVEIELSSINDDKYKEALNILLISKTKKWTS